MLRRSFPLFLCLFALALASCDAETVAPLIEETTFAADLGVDLAAMTRTESGLYYRDLTEGTGPAVQPGHTVAVYYVGRFPSGEQFDARATGQAPFEFRLGVGSVIRGWDEGVAGVRVGGTRQLVVPPHLGYGSRPRGSIPGNSILVFEVTVVGFR